MWLHRITPKSRTHHEWIIALHRFTDTKPGFLAAISHQGLEIDLVRYLEGVPSPPVAVRHKDRNGTAKMADFACSSNCPNDEPMPSPNRSSTSLQRRESSGFPTFFLQLRVVWLGKRHIFSPEALIPLPAVRCGRCESPYPQGLACCSHAKETKVQQAPSWIPHLTYLTGGEMEEWSMITI